MPVTTSPFGDGGSRVFPWFTVTWWRVWVGVWVCMGSSQVNDISVGGFVACYVVPMVQPRPKHTMLLSCC